MGLEGKRGSWEDLEIKEVCYTLPKFIVAFLANHSTDRQGG